METGIRDSVNERGETTSFASNQNKETQSSGL